MQGALGGTKQQRARAFHFSQGVSKKLPLAVDSKGNPNKRPGAERPFKSWLTQFRLNSLGKNGGSTSPHCFIAVS